jgi:hypothetical protein
MMARGPVLIALVCFVALTAGDILTTWSILAAGGIELNPLMAPVIDHIVLIKIAAVALVAGITIQCERSLPGAGPVAPGLAAGVTCLPVVHNLAVLGAV